MSRQPLSSEFALGRRSNGNSFLARVTFRAQILRHRTPTPACLAREDENDKNENNKNNKQRFVIGRRELCRH